MSFAKASASVRLQSKEKSGPDRLFPIFELSFLPEKGKQPV
jgi:hypothetical protein